MPKRKLFKLKEVQPRRSSTCSSTRDIQRTYSPLSSRKCRRDSRHSTLEKDDERRGRSSTRKNLRTSSGKGRRDSRHSTLEKDDERRGRSSARKSQRTSSGKGRRDSRHSTRDSPGEPPRHPQRDSPRQERNESILSQRNRTSPESSRERDRRSVPSKYDILILNIVRYIPNVNFVIFNL